MRLTAFDLRADDPALCAAAQELGVRLTVDSAKALAGAGIVFCLATADQAYVAARQCAQQLPVGTLWCDGNSCAPDTKREAAEVIAEAGSRYVDMAIMAAVHPGLHKTPLLLSGPGAGAAMPLLAALEMNTRLLGAAVGAASTVKMLRSVMIKGMEALCGECFLAARRAGVEEEVIGSLMASNPGTDWPRQGGYNLERMMRHGLCRATEMHEVVATLRDLGLPGDLTSAVADWHQRIGALGLGDQEDGLIERADMLLERL